MNRRRAIYFINAETVTDPTGHITDEHLLDLRNDVLSLLPQSWYRNYMRWVWPLADADENKLVVAHASSDPAEV